MNVSRFGSFLPLTAVLDASMLDLDNTVIFHHRVEKEDWNPRGNMNPNLDVSGAIPRRAGS